VGSGRGLADGSLLIYLLSRTAAQDTDLEVHSSELKGSQVRFRAGPRRVRRCEEEDEAFNFEERPASGTGSGRVFLERWARRASYRRAKLAGELLSAPINPERIEQLRMWLRNLESRKAWLEARLEHNLGLESILQAAIERQRSPKAP
jgi:hypothetical protein